MRKRKGVVQTIRKKVTKAARGSKRNREEQESVQIMRRIRCLMHRKYTFAVIDDNILQFVNTC